MAAYEKRRAAVQRLINERFHGRIADFARSIERSPAHVWQLLHGHHIGEKLARHIERALALQHGILDDEQPSGISGDELELLNKYRASTPVWRAFLRHISGIAHEQQDKRLTEALSLLIVQLGARPNSSHALKRLQRRPGVLQPPQPKQRGKKK